MLEFLLIVLIYPIARKVGEPWIECLAGIINKQLAKLLKAAVRDSSKERDVLSFLEEHPQYADKLTARIGSLMGSDVTTLLKNPPTTIAPGAKLQYYKIVFDWILGIASKLQRDLVLKGFYHGKNYLSYFIVGNIHEFPASPTIVSDRYLTIYPMLDVYVERIDEPSLLEDKYLRLNEEIRMSRFGKLKYDDYSHHKRIETILENWVKYLGPGDDFLELSPQLQDELRIRSYSALKEMTASLLNLVETEITDRDELLKTLLETTSNEPE